MTALTRGSHADRICTTPTIPTLSMRQLFSVNAPTSHSLLRVPPFQRRYCWGKTQIDKYLSDLAPLCTAPSPRSTRAAAPCIGMVVSGMGAHSLGRVLLTRRVEDHHLTVVDGQQRCTTTCLLLSSLRDFLMSQPLQDASVRELAQGVVDDINGILFPLRSSSSSSSSSSSACVLQPTYFDRASFDRCVQPAAAGRIGAAEADADEEDHVLRVRAMFDDVLHSGQFFGRVRQRLFEEDGGEGDERIVDCVSSVVDAVLDKICVLFFVAAEHASEAQAMYARMAVREKAILSMAHNPNPGVNLDEVDMCRNVILSVFSNGTEREQVAVFERFWLPIESLAKAKAVAAAKEGDGRKRGKETAKMSDFLSAMLNAFVEAEVATRAAEKEKSHSKQQVAGVADAAATSTFNLYSRLRECIEVEMSRAHGALANSGEGNEAALREGEQKNVLAFLERFLDFGREHWKDIEPPSSEDQMALIQKKVIKKACWCEKVGTQCTDCIVKTHAKLKK